MSIAFWPFVSWRWLLQANLAENLVTARPRRNALSMGGGDQVVAVARG
jgi:hypothetical protein